MYHYIKKTYRVGLKKWHETVCRCCATRICNARHQKLKHEIRRIEYH